MPMATHDDETPVATPDSPVTITDAPPDPRTLVCDHRMYLGQAEALIEQLNWRLTASERHAHIKMAATHMSFAVQLACDKLFGPRYPFLIKPGDATVAEMAEERRLAAAEDQAFIEAIIAQYRFDCPHDAEVRCKCVEASHTIDERVEETFRAVRARRGGDDAAEAGK